MTTRFTRIYGLGWTMEFPPTEQDGKQVILVGADNNPISTERYLNARLAAALQGEVFNPQIGFALVGNTARPSKYPFNPYYGERSPRIAAAWDMFGNGTTVLRGGYGRTYGRINGVDLVLVPLLGVGQIRPVQCTATRANGTCGSSPSDPTNAFRIGTDGLKAPLSVGSPTLPQPVFPGVNEIPVRVCGPRSEFPAECRRFIHTKDILCRSKEPSTSRVAPHFEFWQSPSFGHLPNMLHFPSGHKPSGNLTAA